MNHSRRSSWPRRVWYKNTERTSKRVEKPYLQYIVMGVIGLQCRQGYNIPMTDLTFLFCCVSHYYITATVHLENSESNEENQNVFIRYYKFHLKHNPSIHRQYCMSRYYRVYFLLFYGRRRNLPVENPRDLKEFYNFWINHWN